MKAIGKKLLLAFAGALLVGLFLLLGLGRSGNSAQAALERTRRDLRSAGFKLNLSEFDFTQSPESVARAAALDNAGQDCYLLLSEAIDFLPPVGTNSALVMCDEPVLLAESCTNLWAELRAKLNHEALAAACAAAISGPYRARVQPQPDGGIRLQGGGACRLACPLAARTLLALSEHDHAEVWTNLLALTCLVARWQAQPAQKDAPYWQSVNLVRAYGVTWQTIQSRILSEPQLASLQREWEAADFRSGLPERAALTCAEIEHQFKQEFKREPPEIHFRLFGSPAQTWQQLTERRNFLRYRDYVLVEDEESLLLLFRDCERDYRQVQACTTWQEIVAMRQLASQPPGFTNLVVSSTNFNQSARYRRLGNVSAFNKFAFGSRIPELLRVAGSESMRRLLVAALAIERYRLRHGGYPESPDALTPELLASWPMDFMDGRPLRYWRGNDGRFLLYSIGHDLRDYGGINRIPEKVWASGPDQVWPRPASSSEVAAEITARRQLPTTRTEGRTFIPLQ